MSSLAAPHERQTSEIALADLLDRLLGAGVVLSGDIIISLAGVDLVEVRLRALISSIRTDADTGDRHGAS